ncbi:hypothetical protein BD770DRAFT_330277 [Pilaira anomala]|nr:hypothetical protein BD770DRAFT_330277 [Pilaira anomala]
MEAVPNFPDGFFFIRCKSQPFALDVNNGILDIKGGSIEREKTIIQYARKPGLAQNQRWTYRDGYIFPSSAPHLVLDIRGGEYKNGTSIWLNSKNLHSQTQQWIIQPFQNEKSNAELSLLRPSPLQRTSMFPRQEELYDCYRMVYLESGTTVTPEELAGAAAFKGMKDYVESIKRNGPIVADEVTRKELIYHVEKEVFQVLNTKHINGDIRELVNSAKTVAESYFSREYSSN